jgi:hypothetical protein
MTKRERLEGLLKHYERLINEMQGQVFFVQDAEGVLRRWYPPTTVASDLLGESE